MNNIVDATCTVIKTKYGEVVFREFSAQIKLYSGGNYKNWGNLPPSTQIRHINGFWRSVLSTIPNTVDIRAWLNEGESISAYIDAFDHNWSALAIATGVFTPTKLRKVS